MRQGRTFSEHEVRVLAALVEGVLRGQRDFTGLARTRGFASAAAKIQTMKANLGKEDARR